MLENKTKTMNDRIMEKIFYINDGLYEIPTSIGNLFVNKQTLKNDREDGYDNKKIQINIYKDDDTIYSKYSKDYRYYLGTGDLGGYGNYDRQYAIDFPEIEVFKKLKFETYGYDRKDDKEIIVYLDNCNNKQYRIVSDGIRLYEENSIKEFYEIQNDRIVINNSMAIDINTSNIFVNINGKFVKINSNDNIEEKLISYVNKLRVLKKYLQEDMKEIFEILNIDYDLKIGKDNSLSIKDCKFLGEKLKDMRLLYLDASKIINYKHDEQVKMEIASGLNEYYQDRASGITVECYNFADDTKNIDLINKLVKLNNGFYFVNTTNGIIGIDVNLDKNLEIIVNDEVIFEMSYGKIYKNIELEKNVVEQVLQNIDKVLEQQQNKQKVLNELEKERKIKILEKQLHELRNS